MLEDINVNAISEALNNKADLDLQNVNATGKASTVVWGMPDYSNASAVTFASASPFWTAPKDGFIYVWTTNSSGQAAIFAINNQNVFYDDRAAGAMGTTIPICKGDVVTKKDYITQATFFPCKAAQ